MPQISIEFALTVAANAVVVAVFVGRLHTDIEVLKTKIAYLERRLRVQGTLPADLGVH